MIGSRFSIAISCARRIFLQVIGNQAPALTVGVVGNDHALAAADLPEPDHHRRQGRRPIPHTAPGRERPELEEARTGVDERGDTLAREQLAERPLALGSALPTSLRDLPALRLEHAQRVGPVVAVGSKASSRLTARGSVLGMAGV